MYEGVAGHGAEAEANLGLGCGLPTRHAGAREGDTMLGLGAGAGNEAFVARALVGEHGRMIGIDMTAPLATGRGRTPTGSATPTSMEAGMLASFGISATYEI